MKTLALLSIMFIKPINEHFHFNPPVSISAISRAIRQQADYTLKLLSYQPEDYNSEERIAARVQWTSGSAMGGADLSEAVFIGEGFQLVSYA
ncbi:hypothetical protein BX616_001009 [Lobosporangium transversale]|uniref:Uncharacterized protein n=1 Tax=Lobosporangium transversale TaxID=64571 RepID=A0A1Y2H113_9FUNG|nr:hypothetical protein BCR41DRAFT_406410 [Lobosporangium transversale]KAF9905451.1 hypothetical protein BX616_001009 [Lobosporangium transversale]ORZ28247.1 hypothetical protein BCR41DRAFT_406410 [Lobosporangium transversale]|eukprot:XP_021885932.1 hypothetical protein BCR41DRAFT_406410 [Lobosporangium transversale]